MDDATLDRLAELAVRFGSNVQPGQIVAVGAEVGKERVARAVAAQAYAAGAKFVDVSYFDLRVKRARIENAAEDTLDFVPSWYGERLLALGDQRAARVGLSGPADPHALEGLDPARVGKDLLPGLRETGKVVNDATTNWTIIPAITRAWAELVHQLLVAILGGRGRVSLDDGSWTVVGPDMARGAKVRIVAVNGTELKIEPAP